MSDQYGSTPSSSGSSTSWLTSLASLAGAGVTAYNNANKPKKPANNSSLLFIVAGAVGLLLVVVLILKK